MARWSEFEVEAPELAAQVRERFGTRKHATLATLRSDGSPRISGTEVEFSDGDVWLGSMPDALKAQDLRRDGRFALHSPTADPPEDNPEAWPGEAKLAGTAHEEPDRAPGDPHRFRLDIREAVVTRVRGNLLHIDSWHPGRGVEHRERT